MAKPFLFDNRDFDQLAEANALPAEARPQFSQNELNGAVHVAQQRGFEEGLANATQGLDAQMARMFESLAAQIQTLQAAEVERTAASQTLAIEIAAGLMRKLVPDLANQQSLEGISAIVRQVMMDRFEEPRLIIRTHDSMLDALSARLETLSKQSGFRGQYALMADTNLAPTDCRIEWSNGGVERSVARLWDNLQVTLAQIQATLAPAQISEPISPTSNESDAT
jgi:flagellar assembly protein FliH